MNMTLLILAVSFSLLTGSSGFILDDEDADSQEAAQSKFQRPASAKKPAGDSGLIHISIREPKRENNNA